MFAAVALAAAALAPVGIPGTAVADQVVGEHVFFIAGESTVSDFFQYKQFTPFECDRAVPDAATCRAAFGIPRPMLNAAKKPFQDGALECDLARNIGPAGPGPLFPGGERYVPCAGSLTHTTHVGPHGCVEATNAADTRPLDPCSFTGGSTWFYGFCGQTYGGAEGVLFRFGGSDHVITRMGFTRPAGGVWEFNGRLTKGSVAGATDGYVKLYLSAVPNPADPSRAAACEQIAPNLEKIWWQGIAIVSDSPALTTATIAAKKPGWHWCDGTDGC